MKNFIIKNKYIVSIGLAVMIFILILVFFLVDSQRSNNTQDINLSPSSYSVNVPNKNEAWEPYKGKYISAKVPNSWKLEEKINGEGLKTKVGTSENPLVHKGLTGIIIYDDLNEKVFTLAGVEGIGGIAVCDPIYKFSDTDPKYILMRQKQAKGYLDKNASIENIQKIYYEYSLFDRQVRRSDNNIYWQVFNNVYEQGSFNPECGYESEALKFKDISFEYGNDIDSLSEESLYEAVVLLDIDSPKLITLDKILDSLSAL